MKTILSKEVAIGASVIIALAILIIGIDFLKGVNIFTPANYYSASFTNVEGLAQSAPVTINGYKVGLVRSIEYEYDNPGHVKVELSLDKNLKVPQGSKAVLTSDLLGTASIALKLSDSSDYHDIGDKLIGENASGMMEAVSGDLLPSISAIMPKVDTLLSNINALVADPALTASVRRLDAITANLENTSRNLSALTSRLSPVVTDVNKITSNVAGITGDLSEISGIVKDAPIDSLLNDLQATTANLRQISEQLNDPNSTIGKLTTDPALYNSINSTVSSLDSLFVDIKRNPKRYVTIKVF